MSDQTDTELKEGSKAWLESEVARLEAELATAKGSGQAPFHERSGAVTINAKGEVQKPVETE